MDASLFFTETVVTLEMIVEIIESLGYTCRSYENEFQVTSRADAKWASRWKKRDYIDNAIDEDDLLEEFTRHQFIKNGTILIVYDYPMLDEILSMISHIMSKYGGLLDVDYTNTLFRRDELEQIKPLAYSYHHSLPED